MKKKLSAKFYTVPNIKTANRNKNQTRFNIHKTMTNLIKHKNKTIVINKRIKQGNTTQKNSNTKK